MTRGLLARTILTMTIKKPRYELLDHTADMGMAVNSSGLQELFKQAAAAMLDIILENPPKGKGRKIRVSLEGADLTDLMVRWLGEILYMLQGDGLVVTDIEFEHLTSVSLRAVAQTVPFKPGIHIIRHEIKAVTYHQSLVSQDGTGWKTKIIFDM